MNEQSKSLFTSVTFWGLVLTVGSPLLARFGIMLPGDVAGLANDIVTGIGAITTLYGRVRAAAPVHVLPASSDSSTPGY